MKIHGHRVLRSSGREGPPGETQPPPLGDAIISAYCMQLPKTVQFGVLDVIPGVQRVPISSSNAPPSQSTDLVKIALIALTMSQLVPAMPLSLPMVCKQAGSR